MGRTPRIEMGRHYKSVETPCITWNVAYLLRVSVLQLVEISDINSSAEREIVFGQIPNAVLVQVLQWKDVWLLNPIKFDFMNNWIQINFIPWTPSIYFSNLVVRMFFFHFFPAFRFLKTWKGCGWRFQNSIIFMINSFSNIYDSMEKKLFS